MSYFEKKVKIHIQYMHTDGDKIPDTFNIHIMHRNQVHMLTNLEWTEVNKIISTLEEDDKPIQLWRTCGIGREILDVPKWARKQLAVDLRKVKKIEDEKMEKSIIFKFSELKNHKYKGELLFEDSLLIDGAGGSGKTFAIKKMISELLNRKKRVLVVDFRGEYKDITEKHQGLSLNSEEAFRIDVEADLVRIHFGRDVVYDEDSYNIEFLPSLASEFDYIILDDTYLMLPDNDKLDPEDRKSVSGICSELIQRNLSLNIILSFQSTTSLTEKDRDSLMKLFPRQLLFLQIKPTSRTHKGLEDDFLRCQEQGECAFFVKSRLKLKIGFKESY